MPAPRCPLVCGQGASCGIIPASAVQKSYKTTMTNPPTRVGNYQLEQEIGQGGMSKVWLARHRLLENRQVAVKLLLSDDNESIERFTREANITSRLRHEHIVQIYDHGYQHPY